MSDIDPLDPLLPMFALQHDFRERFFHALQEIERTLGSDDLDRGEKLDRVGEITFEALDHESIKAWLEQNRPMPWLDEVLDAQVEDLNQRVLDVIPRLLS